MTESNSIAKTILNLEVFTKEPAIWNPDVKEGNSSLLSARGTVLRTFSFFYHLMGLPFPEIIILIYRVVN